jgi:hypothetical protein
MAGSSGLPGATSQRWRRLAWNRSRSRSLKRNSHRFPSFTNGIRPSRAQHLNFGKAKWSAARNACNGKRRRRPTARAEDEWIEIRAGSPRLVDEELWQRVQDILVDPERVARRPKPCYSYPLRGRIKCRLCGVAKIGLTVRTKTRLFHFYVCRVAFDRRQDRTCPARNVRADKLEAGIRREIRSVLINPTRVLREMEHQRDSEVDQAEIAR